MNDNIKKTNGPVGAVMVVGGGIGGIQASLDLVNSGYKVYLVDESTAIGGKMAQLDKTFPTNDCSMCIISPKLVEVGKDRNIEIITNSVVESVDGEVGNFEVTLRVNPRFIDLEKCTGCGECIKNCPIELPDEFNENLNNRKAIYKRYPQAVPNAFAIEKLGTAPCKAACPSHIHVEGYVALIKQGKYGEALKLIKKDNPFPSVCGRVCVRFCEEKCTRAKVDEPIAINYLKRFVSDYDLRSDDRYMPEVKESTDTRVAIVGAGPAGLTCAYYLALEGHGVTVFEALPVPGGMLAVGIPDYRLPKDILRSEIEVITKLGVEIRTNVKVGTDITLTELKDSGYDAIFIGVGAHRSRKLGVDGEDLDGVIHGVDYLKSVALGEKISLGKRVAVIGGGNVAIDTVRTALRLGSEEAFVIYRRTREEMPAHEEEIADAEEEGITIHYLSAPTRIIGENGKVRAVECIRMELGEPDESGRRRPVPVAGSEFTIEVDAILPAIGQSLDGSFIDESDDLKLSERGLIEADPGSHVTDIPYIFAGGDAVSGPATAIEAIAAGKEAAFAINRYLKYGDISKPLPQEYPALEIDISNVEKTQRQRMPMLSPEERIGGFKEVQLGFNEEQSLQEASRCLECGVCSECLQCVESCLANAIEHDMVAADRVIEVGSVVLSPGLDVFDPALKGQFGYGRLRNVVTSLEFERILSASGPFSGEVIRPSDKKHPRKVAWIQCVGSRDTSCGNDFCSSVCCMYATKEAIIAREHDSNIEPTIFYMDIRAFGKEFDSYYERARDEYGVRYIRCMVTNLEERSDSGNILIRYIDDAGARVEEEFDLVVLSVGMVPSESTKALCERLGVEMETHGFCHTSTFEPLKTSREGIFVCGAFQSPKDIPETVAQASGAAAYAGGVLAPARGALIEEVIYPEEKDINAEEPRIGVFVCNCGINIGGVVDVPAVREYAATLPNVVFADENLYTCSQDTQGKIRDAINEHNINRVVVASCSPRTHEPLFQSTIREAGLNKYLFEMANIRDQCSWVHMHEKERATEKAMDLVRMAVANAGQLIPLRELTLDVNHRGLVIGGGQAGMAAALRLAEQGYEVTLVEKEAELGGNLRNIYYTIQGDDVQKYLSNLIERVEAEPRITVIRNAVIDGYEGYKGNFVTSLLVGPTMRAMKIEHGITIVATGGEESKPTEYLYGENERVLTQKEFEKRIALDESSLKSLNEFVMIQCVGSRDDQRPYCSRICCSVAIKNALKIKEINPDARVYILYRDIRTYGLLEEYYTKARERGVIFIRYDLDRKPEVTAEGESLSVVVYDPVLKLRVRLDPDLLILSSAIVPQENEELSTLLKINRTRDNFYLEAHMKLRPVDSATEGIFFCGMAHLPKLIEETVSQSAAAAARAITILSKEKLQAEGVVATVIPELCAACLTCVRTCPFGVPFINEEGVAEINPALCQGCGCCASECPGKAIELQNYRDTQIIAKCEGLMKRVTYGKV
jgi:homotetrameric NADPH-dependent glutamate synthase